MRKLFLDLGPGILESEAWDDRWKNYCIIGLEPDEKRFRKLRKEYPGILLKVAAWDKNGYIKGATTFKFGFMAFHKREEEEIVPSITLDKLYELLGDFAEVALWLDIEGSELRALKGAENVLQDTTWINIEVRNESHISEWATADEIYEFLGKRGFESKTSLKQVKSNRTHRDVIFER